MAVLVGHSEERGIQPIPRERRVLGLWDGFVLWADLGVSFLVMVVGMFLVPGLGLAQALLAAVVGAVVGNLIWLLVICATAAALLPRGVRDVGSAADAARALEPFAGRFAEALFAVGLLGASLLAAAILPVTAAYVISETFGLEKGIARRPREAPVFVAVITILIAIGAVVAMIPGVPVIKLLVLVQIVNGALLPITLFFVWRLARNEELMGGYRNGRGFDLLAAATVFATSGLSLLLLAVTLSGNA